jgi:hypothetical protein
MHHDCLNCATDDRSTDALNYDRARSRAPAIKVSTDRALCYENYGPLDSRRRRRRFSDAASGRRFYRLPIYLTSFRCSALALSDTALTAQAARFTEMATHYALMPAAMPISGESSALVAAGRQMSAAGSFRSRGSITRRRRIHTESPNDTRLEPPNDAIYPSLSRA